VRNSSIATCRFVSALIEELASAEVERLLRAPPSMSLWPSRECRRSACRPLED
jgi:hypothetical protein